MGFYVAWDSGRGRATTESRTTEAAPIFRRQKAPNGSPTVAAMGWSEVRRARRHLSVRPQVRSTQKTEAPSGLPLTAVGCQLLPFRP